MGEFSPWHWAIVVLAFVVIFGGRKLPEAARGIGQSLRIFKAEIKAGNEDAPPPAAEAAPLNPAQPTHPTTTTTPPATTS